MAEPNMKILLFLCLAVLAVTACRRTPQRRKLWFRSDGTFKIVVFADLHYGENAWEDWGPQQDRNSDRVMSDILDAEKPDLVVFLGDLLTANNIATQNATNYWEQVTRPTAQRNIPWAAVFGNHDDMAFEWPSEWFGDSGIPGVSSGNYVYFQGTTRKQLMQKEELNSLSVSMSGHASLWPSVSNFALEVSSRNKDGSTGAILYFLDSGGGLYPEVISAGQARWFRSVASELNEKNKTQEFIFWHIPSKAYESVAPKGPISSPCIGSINKEKVASQVGEWGIMDILASRPSSKAVIVGHNHGLDWCCPYGPHSLWLCFARHSGYGGYGSWTRGARVIELSETLDARTWIRLEDGSILSTFEMDIRRPLFNERL